VVAAPVAQRQIASSGPDSIAAERFAEARFTLAGAAHALELYWLSGYAGGLFLAFGDSTSGSESYGGGRYLLDTAKGADLGGSAGRLVVDLNFLYHPSCRYNDAWLCPLAPPGNTISTPVSGGERLRHPLA
jgi:uncharacterized protein